MMRTGIINLACGVAALLSATAAPALAMTNEDVAGALGMLWRIREGACPKISLDADRFGDLIQPRGMRAAEIRRRYAQAFDQGYAVAGDWQAGGPDDYCKAVRQLFDGKTDFFGAAKAKPDAPPPGLTFRD